LKQILGFGYHKNKKKIRRQIRVVQTRLIVSVMELGSRYNVIDLERDADVWIVINYNMGGLE